MKEVWKDIYFINNGIVCDYRGLYQVSSWGRVKSSGNKSNHKEEKILKPSKDKRGYLQVSLRKNGTRKNFRVHRLVGVMFLHNSESKPYINHINGCKDDNRLENLEFCTNSENQIHAYQTGLQKITKKRRKTAAKLGKKYGGKFAKKVIQYDLRGNEVKVWSSQTEAKAQLNINNICACCKGKIKTAGGYIWKYSEEV
jgi:hypothetical protein